MIRGRPTVTPPPRRRSWLRTRPAPAFPRRSTPPPSGHSAASTPAAAGSWPAAATPTAGKEAGCRSGSPHRRFYLAQLARRHARHAWPPSNCRSGEKAKRRSTASTATPARGSSATPASTTARPNSERNSSALICATGRGMISTWARVWLARDSAPWRRRPGARWQGQRPAVRQGGPRTRNRTARQVTPVTRRTKPSASPSSSADNRNHRQSLWRHYPRHATCWRHGSAARRGGVQQRNMTVTRACISHALPPM